MKYRCQSALKLVELEETFHFLQRSHASTVVDLAAAPGGFSQVEVEYMLRYKKETPEKDQTVLVVATDQRPIAPLPQVHTLRANYMQQEKYMALLRPILKLSLPAGPPSYRPVDGVLHDGVSVIKGQRNYSVTYAQSQMVLSTLQLACKIFHKYSIPETKQSPCGTAPLFFVTKAMQCDHLPQVQDAIRSLFQTVETHKPMHSRPESDETYIVAQGLNLSAFVKQQRSGVIHARTPYSNTKRRQNLFSLPPNRNDVDSHNTSRIIWYCLGCGATRVGCTPCPTCSGTV
ncbi:FtsJ-like methyltransferase, putative [Angomonas deanei]|uniref:FtsJ-like methyltransferase, putative n=1 Tax=Angomonas deanei TaxID=59799 RepID=A0A7G2C2H5_9TRYP|nr:FtsJ-like methyltransferase, putative [Angomonas deanei]